MKRIFIADSQPVFLEGVKSVLRQRGECTVIGEAFDGPEALQKLALTEPDLAILDYQLSDASGTQIFHTLQAHCPSTRVLVFAQSENDALLRDILGSGIRALLLKSASASQIHFALGALMENRSYYSPTISDRLISSFITRNDAEPIVLTPKEQVVVKLIAEGYTNKKAAAILSVSPKTVETHRTSLMGKLQVRTIASLVRYAVRNNLIEA